MGNDGRDPDGGDGTEHSIEFFPVRLMSTQHEIYTGRSTYHEINVTDYDFLRVLRFQRNRQSSMYLDAPYETDFEYPAYLHTPLAIKPDARRALVIGLGGGSVVKRYWRDYPEMWLDVVELDPEIVDVAYTYFALPRDERIRVFVDDGRRFLDTTNETYDIVIIDAFDEDQVPRQLTTDEFLREVRDHLSPGGVIAYNFIGVISGERSKPFRSLYRTLCNVWRRVWVFTMDEGVDTEGVNLILLASDAPLTDDELRQRLENRVYGRVSVPGFAMFSDDLYPGKVRTGDVPIITDPPAGKQQRRRR
jgi:spermidine synthase